MTKKLYIYRMMLYEKAFDKLWTKIVRDTNKFVDDCPDVNMYSLSNNVEKFVDNLCLSGAWIHDRIEKKSGAPSNKNYRGSLTKKIRKALGYTI